MPCAMKQDLPRMTQIKGGVSGRALTYSAHPNWLLDCLYHGGMLKRNGAIGDGPTSWRMASDITCITKWTLLMLQVSMDFQLSSKFIFTCYEYLRTLLFILSLQFFVHNWSEYLFSL
jgi:hypothetical protein